MRQDETTAILSRSFGAVADEYNRLRSGPSAEALDWLLPEGAGDVLEIGAGTGILTRLLAERVAHVTAVEPDDRMRAVLAAGDAGVEILAGRAEEIPAASFILRPRHRRIGLALGRRGACCAGGGTCAAARRAPVARVERARPLCRLDAVAVGRRHRVQP